MGGRIEILKDVVANTGKKFYRDKSINEGTRSVFDVAITDMGGAANLPAGASLGDLTYNNNTGVFSLAKTYSAANKGMIFAGVKNDGFDLNEAGCMKVADKHWLFTAWLKITKAGTASSFNNQLLHFSTVDTNGYPNALLSIVPTLDASGVVTKIELGVRGKNYIVTTQLASLYDGNRHQLAIECSISDDGTQNTIKVYLDKVQVFSSTSSVAATLPGEPVRRRIGTTNPFPLAWTGLFYRARVDDLTLTDLTASEVLTADYDLCASRFS